MDAIPRSLLFPPLSRHHRLGQDCEVSIFCENDMVGPTFFPAQKGLEQMFPCKHLRQDPFPCWEIHTHPCMCWLISFKYITSCCNKSSDHEHKKSWPQWPHRSVQRYQKGWARPSDKEKCAFDFMPFSVWVNSHKQALTVLKHDFSIYPGWPNTTGRVQMHLANSL